MKKYSGTSVMTLCMVGLFVILVADIRAMQTDVEGSGQQTSGDSEQGHADHFFNDLFTRFMENPCTVNEFDTDCVLRQNLQGLLWVMPDKKEAVRRAVAIFDRYKQMPDTVKAAEVAFLRTVWVWSRR